MTKTEEHLIAHFIVLEKDVDNEILRRKRAIEYPGGQQVSVTGDFANCNLSALLEIKRRCKWALTDINKEDLEEVRKRFL